MAFIFAHPTKLIQQLYQKILIPQAVYQELIDERAGKIVILGGSNWSLVTGH